MTVLCVFLHVSIYLTNLPEIRKKVCRGVFLREKKGVKLIYTLSNDSPKNNVFAPTPRQSAQCANDKKENTVFWGPHT